MKIHTNLLEYPLILQHTIAKLQECSHQKTQWNPLECPHHKIQWNYQERLHQKMR